MIEPNLNHIKCFGFLGSAISNLQNECCLRWRPQSNANSRQIIGSERNDGECDLKVVGSLGWGGDIFPTPSHCWLGAEGSSALQASPVLPPWMVLMRSTAGGFSRGNRKGSLEASQLAPPILSRTVTRILTLFLSVRPARGKSFQPLVSVILFLFGHYPELMRKLIGTWIDQ